MNFKKFLTALVTAVLLATSAGAYTAQRSYNGAFTDVAANAWYYDEVASAYSLGLINGKSASTFDPDGNLTLAETIKLAASCHQLLVDGKTTDLSSSAASWYDGYINYAVQNGIVTEDYEDYNAAATRGQVAVLFSRALTAAGGSMDEINTVTFGFLPDVSIDAWYSGAVYRMYRWGIMTGDSAHCIYPESSVKRSEISAVVMRMIDPGVRVRVNADGTTAQAGTASAVQNVVTQTAVSKISLYKGEKTAQSFSGVTGVAADFTVSGGAATLDCACSLSLVMNVELEKDCISFQLYDGYGYEAFGIVRGWLNSAAVGANGTVVSTAADVYDGINGLMYLYVNGSRIPITQLWYADHRDGSADGYTTYAFYFADELDLSAVYDVKFLCGKLDASTLETNGLTELSNLNQSTTVPAYTSSVPSSADSGSSVYYSAVSDAKAGAAEILFEYECDRCCILYGRGLYGAGASDYRLLLIFKNGTTQTIYVGQLNGIRVNSTGNVLYYTVVGPDGKSIDYGVNFN
ncbi:MAG: S-layer homology domain-containing protein [Eubacteriales bacterium]